MDFRTGRRETKVAEESRRGRKTEDEERVPGTAMRHTVVPRCSYDTVRDHCVVVTQPRNRQNKNAFGPDREKKKTPLRPRIAQAN